MPQPQPYERKYDLSNDDGLDIRTQLDVELDDVARCFLETLSNLALIQRDDGELANRSVGVEQLKAELIGGFNPPAPFQPYRPYEVSDSFVTDDGRWFIVNTAFTATNDVDDNLDDVSLVYDFSFATQEAVGAKDAAEAAQEAAELARDQARGARDAAQAARDEAEESVSGAIATASVYSSTEDGLANTEPAGGVNRYFSVATSGDDLFELYRNDDNVAVLVGSYPSASAMRAAADAAALQADRSEQEADRSEAARDTAVQGTEGFFPDELTGRDSVSNGDYFWTPGDSEDVSRILWRRVNSLGSVRVTEEPSTSFIASLADVDVLTTNSGQGYPLQEATRDGTVSGPNGGLNAYLLDLKIINGDPNYYYRFGYFGNGTSGFGGEYKDRILIYKYPKETYDTDSSRQTFIGAEAMTQDFARDGTVQSRVLRSERDPGSYAIVTIDTSKIPSPYGTPINYESGGGSWSWVVHPDAITYKQTSETFGLLQAGAIYYEFNSSSQELLYSYESRGRVYRISFGISNYNDLPNIKKVEYRDLDTAGANWQTAINTVGDWLPPIRIKALTGTNDESADLNYSSGNHGGGGGANGYKTAKNILFDIFIDGQQLDPGEDSYGYCRGINVSVVNAVRASNTVDSQPLTFEGDEYNFTGASSDPDWIEGMVEPASTIRRYVLRQCFNINILPGSMNVECVLKELEPVQIWEDNGPQTFTSGFQASLMFAEGKQGSRVAFENGINSGTKADNPNVWAAIFHGSAGQEVAWMDRSYGVGDGRNVADDRYYIRMGVGGNTKCYHAATYASTPYDEDNGGYRVGGDYRWRGGWSWTRPTDSPFDSVVQYVKGGEEKFAYVDGDGRSMTF